MRITHDPPHVRVTEGSKTEGDAVMRSSWIKLRRPCGRSASGPAVRNPGRSQSGVVAALDRLPKGIAGWISARNLPEALVTLLPVKAKQATG